MTTTIGTLPQTGTTHAAKRVRTVNGVTFAEARCNTRNARTMLDAIRTADVSTITCKRCGARVAKYGTAA